MANETGRFNQNSLNSSAFKIALGIGIFSTFIALVLYGYLGTFSRYGSDDYCLSAFFQREGSFLQLMVERYMTSSSRYTNILFIGLADRLLGWYNVAPLPPLMLTLFVLGTYLFFKEIVRLASWGWSRFLILLLALLVVYFSITADKAVPPPRQLPIEVVEQEVAERRRRAAPLRGAGLGGDESAVLLDACAQPAVEQPEDAPILGPGLHTAHPVCPIQTVEAARDVAVHRGAPRLPTEGLFQRGQRLGGERCGRKPCEPGRKSCS